MKPSRQSNRCHLYFPARGSATVMKSNEPARSRSVTIPRAIENLKASYNLTEPQLTAPLAKGQVVGTIDFKLNDKTIEQRPIVMWKT